MRAPTLSSQKRLGSTRPPSGRRAQQTRTSVTAYGGGCWKSTARSSTPAPKRRSSRPEASYASTSRAGSGGQAISGTVLVATGMTAHPAKRPLGSRHRVGGLVWFLAVRVALPAVHLDFDRLDGHRIRVRVELGQCRELAHPATVEEVAGGDLPLLVHDLERQLLLVADEVHRRVARVRVNRVSPGLELDIVGDAPLEGKRVILRPAWRLVIGAVLAAGAVGDHRRRPVQLADLAHAEDRFAIPEKPELIGLVGVDTMRVLGESGWHCQLAPWALFGLLSHLLDADHDNLGIVNIEVGLEGGKAALDVHDAEVAVIGRGGLAVAFDVEGLVGRAALEGALAEEAHHEGAQVLADLGPERLVVRFENNPLRAAEERLLQEEGEAADRNVLPFGGEVVIAVQGARPPADQAAGEAAQGVDAVLVENAVLLVREVYLQVGDVAEARVQAGRRLPDAARGIGAGHQAGEHAGGPDLLVDAALAVDDVGVEDSRVPLDDRAAEGVEKRLVLDDRRPRRRRRGSPVVGRIDDEEGAALLAVRAGRRPEIRAVHFLVAGENHQVEQVDRIEGVEPRLDGLVAQVLGRGERR